MRDGMHQETLRFLKKKRADYADLRAVRKERQTITAREGKLASQIYSTEQGVGIRVLYRGAWGFAATSSLKPSAVYACAEKALEIARASALCVKERVRLSEEEAAVDQYTTPHKIDPFKVSAEEKKVWLLKLARKLKGKKIKKSLCFLNFYKTRKHFWNTEGADIEQVILESGGGMEVTAVKDGEVQKRSFPNSLGGNLLTGGFEVIESMGLEQQTQKLVEEAQALLRAKPCPAGEFDLILMPPQLCLQIHESCGHAVELDRVFGMETSFAGETFLTPDKLGTFRYASKCVNITADTDLPLGLGTYGYDDEGVKGKRVELIKEGIFNGYLSSRETAAKIGGHSSGAMRAENYNCIPLIRMVNVYLEPGDCNLEDLISSTKRGILMDINKSWSIDHKRLQFQFGCEAAWEIKNGKVTKLLKNPIYYGVTPIFWRSCNAICNRQFFEVCGLPNCGKGIPGQTMHVGHGAAPARFKSVAIGHS